MAYSGDAHHGEVEQVANIAGDSVEMPTYKLTYFDIRGLGEGARLLFHHAGVTFDDHRMKLSSDATGEWPTLKKTTPFGQVPLLEVDGHVIAQSAAIYRFLGRKFGLVPKCEIGEAIVDSLYDAHKDFANDTREYFRVAAGFDKGDKAKLEKDVLEPAKEKYFTSLEKFLSKSEGDYLVGKEVTWADIVIADNLLNTWGSFVPTIFNNHPQVKKWAEHVCALPNIHKWIEERPKTPF